MILENIEFYFSLVDLKLDYSQWKGILWKLAIVYLDVSLTKDGLFILFINIIILLCLYLSE